MSPPSFQLAKDSKGIWWATADVGQKKPVRVNCGDGSRKTAEEIAKREVKRRHQLAEAGRIRWRKFHADKAAAKRAAATSSEPSAAGAAGGDEAPTEDPPLPDPSPPSPAPAGGPAEGNAPPPAPERAAEIASKLRALGDGRPIIPDAIDPPGASAGADDAGGDDGDPPLDNEAGELLAELLAGVILATKVKFITKRLAKLKPPRRPGDTNEKLDQWEADGLTYNLAKVFGKTTTMGPTGKMLVGLVGNTILMVAGSEVMEGAAGQPAAAPPAPAPAPPSEPAGDDGQQPEQPAQRNGTTQNALALGRF